MGRLFIWLGVFFVVMGIFWQFGAKLGLGQLPGDINIKRDNYVVHIPIVTCLIISVVVSLIMWFVNNLRR